MKQELIDKYNVSVPRYTSYPPANFFRPFAGDEFLKEIDYSNEAATLIQWLKRSVSKPMFKYCIRR